MELDRHPRRLPDVCRRQRRLPGRLEGEQYHRAHVWHLGAVGDVFVDLADNVNISGRGSRHGLPRAGAGGDTGRVGRGSRRCVCVCAFTSASARAGGSGGQCCTGTCVRTRARASQ